MPNAILPEVLRTEFDGLSNNEAYSAAWMARVMKPHPTDATRFLGTDQRDQALPFLQRLINELPSDRTAKIFDVGCGAGHIVPLAFGDPAVQSARSYEFTLAEPNLSFLDEYMRTVDEYNPNMKVNRNQCVAAGFPELYSSPAPADHDLLIAMHMIYHLTDFTDESADPHKDVCDFVRYCYESLAPGGTALIVFVDYEGCLAPQASLGYFGENDVKAARNLRRIYSARDFLLARGGVRDVLAAEYPDYSPVIDVIRTDSFFFAQSLEDLAAMAISGEIGCADEEPFDLKKMEFCWEFVNDPAVQKMLQLERLTPGHPFRGERDGWYKCGEHQWCVSIRKDKTFPNQASDETPAAVNYH